MTSANAGFSIFQVMLKPRGAIGNLDYIATASGSGKKAK